MNRPYNLDYHMKMIGHKLTNNYPEVGEPELQNTDLVLDQQAYLAWSDFTIIDTAKKMIMTI